MSQLLHEIRALVIDADGVLWRGNRGLPGVAAFFEFLKARQIKFMIATNNSAHPASDVVERLGHIGATIDENNVLTSAEATARYLPTVVPNAKRVFVVGGSGLSDALTKAGFQVVEQNADAVAVGIDVNLTYEKLKNAAREIWRGAKFIGTNADKTFPASDGLVPGAGSILAALETATGVAPIVVGKPERIMFDIAVAKMQATRETTAALGDRLDTDIAGGQRAGLHSLLVMTGVTTPEILAKSSIRPDLVFGDLNALRETWQRAY
jgi:4-nitrophenyl phosphatase